MKGLKAPKASLGSVTGIHMEAQTSARAVDRAQARLGEPRFSSMPVSDFTHSLSR